MDLKPPNSSLVLPRGWENEPGDSYGDKNVTHEGTTFGINPSVSISPTP